MRLSGLGKNNFIVVGRAGIDFFTDAGVRVEDAQAMTVDLGGSAANTAASLCKQAAKPCWSPACQTMQSAATA